MIIYTVKPGDTLYSISRAFGIPAGRLIIDNDLSSDRLSPGQAIMIAYRSRIYTVREGDSLWSIAAGLGVTVNQLWRNNPNLNGKSDIYPGQTLVIEYADAKLGSARDDRLCIYICRTRRHAPHAALPHLSRDIQLRNQSRRLADSSGRQRADTARARIRREADARIDESPERTADFQPKR